MRVRFVSPRTRQHVLHDAIRGTVNQSCRPSMASQSRLVGKRKKKKVGSAPALNSARNPFPSTTLLDAGDAALPSNL